MWPREGGCAHAQPQAIAAVKLITEGDIFKYAPLSLQQDVEAVHEMLINMRRRISPILKASEGSFFFKILERVAWLYTIDLPSATLGKLGAKQHGKTAIRATISDLSTKATSGALTLQDLDLVQPFAFLLPQASRLMLDDWTRAAFKGMGLAEGVGKLGCSTTAATGSKSSSSSSASKLASSSSEPLSKPSVMSFFG